LLRGERAGAFGWAVNKGANSYQGLGEMAIWGAWGVIVSLGVL